MGEQQHGRALHAGFLCSSADWSREYWCFGSIDDFCPLRRTCIHQSIQNLSLFDRSRGSGGGKIGRGGLERGTGDCNLQKMRLRILVMTIRISGLHTSLRGSSIDGITVRPVLIRWLAWLAKFVELETRDPHLKGKIKVQSKQSTTRENPSKSP